MHTTQQDTTAVAIASPTPQVPPEVLRQVLIGGDLSTLIEADERLTLRHLAAHVTADHYQTLMEGYTAIVQQAVEADVPDFPPPAGAVSDVP